jgi:hypothetical protein
VGKTLTIEEWRKTPHYNRKGDPRKGTAWAVYWDGGTVYGPVVVLDTDGIPIGPKVCKFCGDKLRPNRKAGTLVDSTGGDTCGSRAVADDESDRLTPNDIGMGFTRENPPHLVKL